MRIGGEEEWTDHPWTSSNRTYVLVQVDGVFAGDNILDGAALGLASGRLVALRGLRHCGGRWSVVVGRGGEGS